MIEVRAVTFPGRKQHPLRGHYAQPETPGPHPAVVVIHEVYGLNDNIREVAERLAGAGYAALAVDLFAGRSRALCMTRFLADLFLNSLGHGALEDLRQALGFVAGRPEVDAARLGAIGFCMGGSFAVAWACRDRRLRAIAPFYGLNPRPLEAVRRSCPVVGSYPARDFTAGHGRRLSEELAAAGVAHDIKIYPGARHSFFNDRSASSHHPAAAADAWERTLAFFGEHL